MGNEEKKAIKISSLVEEDDRTKKRTIISIVSIICAIAAVVVLFTAFVWPKWAVTRTETLKEAKDAAQGNALQLPSSPETSVTALPSNATVLMQHMPQTVGAYARKGITLINTWQSANPIEEFTVVYSIGNPQWKDLTITVAQWPTRDGASAQYGAVAAALKKNVNNTEINTGKVVVDGSQTGSYVLLKTAISEAASSRGAPSPVNVTEPATALWSNGTCLFEVTGPLNQVEQFYKQFPL